jgi:hypothetical protein
MTIYILKLIYCVMVCFILANLTGWFFLFFPDWKRIYIPKEGGFLALVISCPFGFFIYRLFRGLNIVLVEAPLQNPCLAPGTLLTNLLPGIAFSFLLLICGRLLFSKKRDPFD